ncbi:hypothetical protein [Natrinema altunense]|uniref:DUF5602 domain-containing protein n=1 Tax=Natrinema altunense (strain JCM 12890 / CGMCC 1.3731 / AJ2) TaxID=1227494 RepID=L9ZCJ4_NATA2|nr:hypothetical protein [Natrinema altunense]ELY84109.1 hypothetical protein C485_16720 [Natrinema altunense JCM 12890]
MGETPQSHLADGRRTARRRTFLRAVPWVGTALTATGTAAGSATDRDFPPPKRTEWSEPISLGNGELRTFTTVAPSGDPTYHGVVLDRDALTGLPSAAELRARAERGEPGDKYGPTGTALEIHHAWSQEFFVPFPETAATPFTFLGLTWNPEGHPPPGTYDVPHLDVHFHMLEAETVDTIDGPRAAAYTIPEARLPAGYTRVPEPGLDGDFAVVTDMGEHLIDPGAPEHTDGEFTNTLIWGAYDTTGNGRGELTFIEPMVTKRYLETVTGTDRYEIPQPTLYPTAGSYPTAYAVRDVPSDDAIAITIEAFTPVGRTEQH